MKTIKIKTAKASTGTLAALEKRGLIKVLKPTPKVQNTRNKTGAVDILYRSSAKHGGHSLLAVGKRNTEIEFSFHPDNEDLIHINPGRVKYKPLYFIVSLLKAGAFLKALKNETLSPRDFTALEIPFNDPRASIFTVLKNTVHCEITLPGKGQHPVFYVTEPAKLKMNHVRTNKYRFIIAG